MIETDMYDGLEYNRLFGYTYHLRSYLIFWTLTFFIHICRIPAILTDITKNSKEKREGTADMSEMALRGRCYQSKIDTEMTS